MKTLFVSAISSVALAMNKSDLIDAVVYQRITIGGSDALIEAAAQHDPDSVENALRYAVSNNLIGSDTQVTIPEPTLIIRRYTS